MLDMLNPWLSLLVFVVSLPLAIMSGAAILGFRDSSAITPGLLRLLICIAVLLLLLLFFGAAYQIPILAAFIVAITAHLAAYWGLRRWVNHR